MSKQHRRDIYQELTDEIVAALERGVAPWVRPWRRIRSLQGCNAIFPVNVRGSSYRGVNVLNLWAVAQREGYTSNIWLTFNQARQAGGSVKQGQKGSFVVFWQRHVRPELDLNGTLAWATSPAEAEFRKFKGKAQDEDQDDSGQGKTIPLVRYYTVFNLDQTEGVNLPLLVEAEPEDIEQGSPWIDELVSCPGADIVHGGDRAVFYGGDIDRISMPVPTAFNSRAAYYATLWHELTHWSGNERRLNRDLSGRFGTSAYAAEELVAELGSAFCSAYCGLE